jgi:methylmalonyl-CoA mutase N-terminal domain/subunit
MRIALRTQQIIADESGVADVVDPLGGSYYVENLTTQYERAIFAVIDEVDRHGGTLKLTEEGWFQRRIADFAYETARKKANGAKPVIGVNKYAMPDERFELELHPYDASTAVRQIAGLNKVRAERDNPKVAALLERLAAIAGDTAQNIMPITIELVTAGATMGDIVEKLKGVWGTYRERPVF